MRGLPPPQHCKFLRAELARLRSSVSILVQILARRGVVVEAKAHLFEADAERAVGEPPVRDEVQWRVVGRLNAIERSEAEEA